ncbi:MAG: DUF3179 domain-containing protein [Chloroflexi bacterium]|nr:DUF3179 domain-containing protein [Chloroflexota bacterium]
MSRLGLLFTLAALLVSSGAAFAAQNTCDDPFDGVTVRFSTSYWTTTDFCTRSIDLSGILSGGPPPDGIPPIDNPQFESIASASEWLAPQSPVIALEVGEVARAYPLAILIWHEIVNDVIGSVPVAVTFCPLCNASVVFDRRVDGMTLRMGVSGNLRNSDLIMWDDQTESWWQQFTGEAIVGSLTGTQLELVPSLVVSFAEFSAQYPDGEVLTRDTGHSRTYGSNPYAGYDSTTDPFLFTGAIDPRLPATERVLAGTIGAEAVAYPFSALAVEQVVNDMAGGDPVVALWQPGAASALDGSTIDSSRDVGMAALYSRILDGETLTFMVDADGAIRDEGTGRRWNVFGEAVEGELAGKRLEPQFAAPHFWFAWAAFRPETRVYGE